MKNLKINEKFICLSDTEISTINAGYTVKGQQPSVILPVGPIAIGIIYGGAFLLGAYNGYKDAERNDN